MIHPTCRQHYDWQDFDQPTHGYNHLTGNLQSIDDITTNTGNSDNSNSTVGGTGDSISTAGDFMNQENLNLTVDISHDPDEETNLERTERDMPEVAEAVNESPVIKDREFFRAAEDLEDVALNYLYNTDLTHDIPMEADEFTNQDDSNLIAGFSHDLSTGTGNIMDHANHMNLTAGQQNITEQTVTDWEIDQYTMMVATLTKIVWEEGEVAESDLIGFYMEELTELDEVDELPDELLYQYQHNVQVAINRMIEKDGFLRVIREAAQREDRVLALSQALD